MVQTFSGEPLFFALWIPIKRFRERKTSEDSAVFGDIAYAESGDLIGLAADSSCPSNRMLPWVGRTMPMMLSASSTCRPVPPEETDQFSLLQFKRHPVAECGFFHNSCGFP